MCAANVRQEMCMSFRCLSVPTPASAVLSYSDMTHAMSTASDCYSSVNCMSALNDGLFNSYTFHTIAFHSDRGLERPLRLSVAIWTGRQSPC